MKRPSDQENLWINLDAALKAKVVAYCDRHKHTPISQYARAGIELLTTQTPEVTALLLHLDRRSRLFRQIATAVGRLVVTAAMPAAAPRPRRRKKAAAPGPATLRRQAIADEAAAASAGIGFADRAPAGAAILR